MVDKKYDVVVIGAGPGGYTAAIRCAQLGLKSACIESWINDGGKPALGGTCLNVGCIPSKALLDSSHHYFHLRHQAAEHGIRVENLGFDVTAMQHRKSKIVQTLTKGIEGLFNKNKVDWLQGHAMFTSATTATITDIRGKNYSVHSKNFVIATGSVPATIPPAQTDEDRIVDSTGALAFEEIPNKLGIIGAGVIGLELGSVWSRLGAEVVILEALEEFLAPVDREISTEARKVLEKQGLEICLGAKVTRTNPRDSKVQVEFDTADGKQQIVVDRLIVAVGRKPNTDALMPEAAGIQVNKQGFIEVDDYCRTSVANIYAIGDVVRGPMLAHKASEEGVMVAEQIAGQAAHMNYETVPWVIYTWPEIAWVGSTEQQLKQSGIAYRSGMFPFVASGRARALGETSGRVKILAENESDRIIGVHILGPNASELIAEAVTAMEFDASAEDLARTIHAHPTLAEAMHEAALAVDGRTINI